VGFRITDSKPVGFGPYTCRQLSLSRQFRHNFWDAKFLAIAAMHPRILIHFVMIGYSHELLS